MQKIILRRRI